MPRSGSDPPLDPRTTERRLWREHPGSAWWLRGSATLAVAAAGCWIAVALALSALVGRVFLEGAPLSAVRAPLVVMVVAIALRSVFLWSSEVVAQRSAEAMELDLRERLARAIVALGPVATRGDRAGELVYVAGEGVASIDAYVTGYGLARLVASIVPLVVTAVIFALDPWTVVVLLFAGPLLVLILALIGRRVRDLTERRERELAWMHAHFLDVLRGLPTLKMFGRSGEQAETIAEVSRRLGTRTMDVLRIAFQTTLVLEWGATAATALVAIEASVRLMDGTLPFQRALAVLLLTPEFFVPLRRLAAEYHTGRAGVAAAARIHAVLDRAPSVTGSAFAPRTPVEVRFEDVWVAFDDGDRVALAGCSFDVAAGATVALVGRSGAGKTTSANVLLRFVEPDRGRVLVDGRPLAELDPADWRRRVAFVPQHPVLFPGSVAENLRVARPDATDEELVAAARAANAHGFVTRLPRGYDEPVGESGHRLSGGERQRLAIARALLRAAPLVVLDEPTAHLDAGNVAPVLEAVERLCRGRTALVIAHTPEVVATADAVVVLEGGRAVEAAGVGSGP